MKALAGWAIVLSVILIGCSGAQTGTAAPTASSIASPSLAPTPVGPTTFESARHGYRIQVPPGWNVVEYPGRWTSIDQARPGAEVPGEDVADGGGGLSFLVVNSMQLPAGTDPAAWLAAVEDVVEANSDPGCPRTKETTVIDGEPAVALVQSCSGSVVVGRTVVHGGRGYYFTTRRPAGSAATEALIDALMESIEFVD